MTRGAQKSASSFYFLFLLFHFAILHGNRVQYVCLVKEGLVAMNECTCADREVIRRFTNENIVIVRPYLMESVFLQALLCCGVTLTPVKAVKNIQRKAEIVVVKTVLRAEALVLRFVCNKN